MIATVRVAFFAADGARLWPTNSIVASPALELHTVAAVQQIRRLGTPMLSLDPATHRWGGSAPVARVEVDGESFTELPDWIKPCTAPVPVWHPDHKPTETEVSCP